MIIKSQELTGRLLDYCVALCEGYTWVKNASHRSGDSYRQSNEPVQWPIGTRCLVAPDKAKNLHPTEKNWDGWVASDGTEELSPRAMYDVPKFSKRPESAWPVINAQGISLKFKEWNGEWHASKDTRPRQSGTQFIFVRWDLDGLVAAMRCYVAYTLGDQIEIPDVVAELLK